MKSLFIAAFFLSYLSIAAGLNSIENSSLDAATLYHPSMRLAAILEDRPLDSDELKIFFDRLQVLGREIGFKNYDFTMVDLLNKVQSTFFEWLIDGSIVSFKEQDQALYLLTANFINIWLWNFGLHNTLSAMHSAEKFSAYRELKQRRILEFNPLLRTYQKISRKTYDKLIYNKRIKKTENPFNVFELAPRGYEEKNLIFIHLEEQNNEILQACFMFLLDKKPVDFEFLDIYERRSSPTEQYGFIFSPEAKIVTQPGWYLVYDYQAKFEHLGPGLLLARRMNIPSLLRGDAHMWVMEDENLATMVFPNKNLLPNSSEQLGSFASIVSTSTEVFVLAELLLDEIGKANDEELKTNLLNFLESSFALENTTDFPQEQSVITLNEMPEIPKVYNSEEIFEKINFVQKTMNKERVEILAEIISAPSLPSTNKSNSKKSAKKKNSKQRKPSPEELAQEEYHRVKADSQQNYKYRQAIDFIKEILAKYSHLREKIHAHTKGSHNNFHFAKGKGFTNTTNTKKVRRKGVWGKYINYKIEILLRVAYNLPDNFQFK